MTLETIPSPKPDPEWIVVVGLRARRRALEALDRWLVKHPDWSVGPGDLRIDTFFVPRGCDLTRIRVRASCRAET